MYKCPKCGDTESFSIQVELTIPYIWIDVNSDGEINDIEEDALCDRNKKRMHYEVLSLMVCNSCGYEAFENEFATVITSNK